MPGAAENERMPSSMPANADTNPLKTKTPTLIAVVGRPAMRDVRSLSPTA